MNQINSNKSSDEHKIFKLKVLIFSIVSVAVGAIAYVLNKIKKISYDPPPIIIKSGIFIFETDVFEPDELITETSDETLSERVADPNLYKRKNFGKIKSVKVLKIDADQNSESFDFEDRNGVEVDISLQKRTNGRDNIGQLVTIRTEDNEANSKDFVLTIGIKLNKKGFPDYPRNHRWEYDGIENLRFVKVVVREKDGGGKTFNSQVGDNYHISFYNKLR